jgi:hypothetical protein
VPAEIAGETFSGYSPKLPAKRLRAAISGRETAALFRGTAAIYSGQKQQWNEQAPATGMPV